MRVNAYAAPAAGRPLAAITIERRDVSPNGELTEADERELASDVRYRYVIGTATPR